MSKVISIGDIANWHMGSEIAKFIANANHYHL